MQDSSSLSPKEDPTSAPETAEETAINRRALLVVFLVVFIDLLGFGIVIPLLPLFADAFVETMIPGTGDSVVGGIILGLLMSSFSAMQFVFAPLWGKISDQYGRRPILLLGLGGSVIFYILFGYAASLSTEYATLALILLFVARLGAGITGATIATAQAAIADSTPSHKRKIGMALIGVAFGIGFTFGPLIGFGCLFFFEDVPGSVGYGAAGLSLIALLWGFIILPETRKFGTDSPRRKWVSWQDTKAILSMPTIGLLVLIFFLTTMGFGAFEPTLALVNKDTLDLSKKFNFLIFAYVGFVLLISQGILYRRLAGKLSEVSFMTIGLVLMGLGLGLLGAFVFLKEADLSWNTLLTGILVSLTVAVMGFAFLTPSVQALISRRSDPERQGEILGVNQSASALARILGPFMGLALYKVPGTGHLLPYAFGAFVLLALLPLIPKIRKEKE